MPQTTFKCLKLLSRKPASLEAGLEVSPLGATEGSSMGPGASQGICSFSGSFRDPFSEHFFVNFEAQNGPQNLPKNGPKISSFLSSRWWLFSLASELPRDALWQSSGPLGAVLGGLKSEKMQTVLCENHFFESRLFGLSELHLALLGSSRPLPGQSWGPDGTQNRPKRDPKSGPKMGPKMDPILGPSWTHFGAHFGVQNGCARGTHFSTFFGVAPEPPSGPILVSCWLHPARSWAHLGPFSAPLGPIVASFWPHLCSLCLSWRPLGFFLALSRPSWRPLGLFLALSSPS